MCAHTYQNILILLFYYTILLLDSKYYLDSESLYRIEN